MTSCNITINLTLIYTQEIMEIMDHVTSWIKQSIAIIKLFKKNTCNISLRHTSLYCRCFRLTWNPELSALLFMISFP